MTVACEGLSLKIADHGLAEVVLLVLGVELVMVDDLVTVDILLDAVLVFGEDVLLDAVGLLLLDVLVVVLALN